MGSDSKMLGTMALTSAGNIAEGPPTTWSRTTKRMSTRWHNCNKQREPMTKVWQHHIELKEHEM
eukprot:2896932-Prorocentrum_lima.AAC.1